MRHLRIGRQNEISRNEIDIIRAVPCCGGACYSLPWGWWLHVFGVSKPEVPSRPRSEEMRKVAVTIADRVSAAPMQPAFGTVSAARSADLRFAIGGEVASVDAIMRNGALVRKGQVLAKLDTELLTLSVNDIAVQLLAENANQVELQTQLTLRQRQYDRVSQMTAASVASEKRLDDAQLALSIAKNSLLQSNSRIEQLKIAKEKSRTQFEGCGLKSPV